MNVASLELCKELYKLSGWEDTSFAWVDSEHKPTRTKHISKLSVTNASELTYMAPAYDLGYLLRKLPGKVKHNGPKELLLTYVDSDKWWLAQYVGVNNSYTLGTQVADTPEDAACNLTIELFKQNILKKEQ